MASNMFCLDALIAGSIAAIIPAIIATGIISLAFGYKTIREMLDGD